MSQGYRRVSPSDQPAKPKVQEKKTGNKSSNRNRNEVNKPSENNDEDLEVVEDQDNFCHFYNNYKKCLFEENTGKKC